MSLLRHLFFFSSTKSLIACLLASGAIDVYALSTKDIFPSDNDLAPAFKKIVTNIREIEPLCTYWSAPWKSTVPKDSVTSRLFKAITGTERIVEEIDIFKLTLFRGLLWHYLYQMEVDSGFIKADRIARELRSKYPDTIEGTWLQGINRVKAAQIFSGFNLLDSLRTSHHSLPDNFYKDYAGLSALTFLPCDLSFVKNQISAPESLVLSMTYDQPASENVPVHNQWEVISTTGSDKKLPGFMFSAEFGLKKPITLTYPLFFDKSTYMMHRAEENTLADNVPHALVFNPDAPPVKMEMKISVQPVKGLAELDQYMFNIVHNAFDEIRTIDALNSRQVIALRCYRKHITRGLSDRYTTYVAFDKMIPLAPPSFYAGTGKKHSPATRIKLRYILSMNTAKEVEKKADDLFLEVLQKFKTCK